MKINLFPLASVISDQINIDDTTSNLLDELVDLSDHSFNIVTNLDELYDSDLTLILVLTGGAEAQFLNALPKLKGPFYILTYGFANSLAASIEILSYINNNGMKGEILHGPTPLLIKRIDELLKENK